MSDAVNIEGLITVMQQITDGLAPITAAMADFRQNLEISGYSHEMAEQIAGAAHISLVQVAISIMTTPPNQEQS